ncbi:heavy-metal-associated domain-containing protein [Sphingomonas sp. AR_OL41]|uniref:heavy-metal-associated domain-containing protein n=1 Tax=Sphingomonas sp. AR_OL41 TaxID=3042729 RepID=UPI002480F1FA|nr:heavy-metal-associated domain-containing protein [Sphingomonas sp. AR_OL41]MDH7970852.1 heavy-metal-associated domain-containing protein [Sphingomonas sp. AR_OL41]
MPTRRFSGPLGLAVALLLATSGGIVLAQADDGVEKNSPFDSSGSYEVDGVQVDVTGKDANAARYAGWRLAQRKGWQLLSQRLGAGGGSLSDSTLDSIVSGIVVEDEQIGPNRYIARLGVLFSRARAGSMLGISSETSRSAPMLLLPIEWSGGARISFEQKTDWQDAWARYRTSNSAVDYVRPAGTGPDALLLNAGQQTRPGRGWWRTILDQYGASDVLIPVVKLYRQWPGGPVVGVFQARHGPDNRLIGQFSLRVGNGDSLPVLLDEGVKRLDEIFQAALQNGQLAPDRGLAAGRPMVPTPTPSATATEDAATTGADQTAVAGATVTIQYDSPSVNSVNATEAALRGTPGVRSAVTTSLALGGISVMRVGFDADPAVLRAELESRGWIVVGSGTTLRIRRPLPPPNLPATDNVTGG